MVYANDKDSVRSVWKGQVHDLVTLMTTEFERLKVEPANLAELQTRWRALVNAHKAELPNSFGRKTEVERAVHTSPMGTSAALASVVTTTTSSTR